MQFLYWVELQPAPLEVVLLDLHIEDARDSSTLAGGVAGGSARRSAGRLCHGSTLGELENRKNVLAIVRTGRSASGVV